MKYFDKHTLETEKVTYMRPVSRERTALSLTPLATKHDTTTHSVPTSGTTERTGIVNVRKPVG